MKLRNHVAGALLILFMQTANAVPVVLEVEFDSFPSETYFGLWTDATAPDPLDVWFVPDLVLDGIAFDSTDWLGVTVVPGFALPGDFLGAVGTAQFMWDLVAGDYTFTIFDVFGDGLCCFSGPGAYSLSVDGAVIGSGGQFFEFESVNFSVADMAVPEPGTLALLLIGIAGIGASRRARR